MGQECGDRRRTGGGRKVHGRGEGSAGRNEEDAKLKEEQRRGEEPNLIYTAGKRDGGGGGVGERES